MPRKLTLDKTFRIKRYFTTKLKDISRTDPKYFYKRGQLVGETARKFNVTQNTVKVAVSAELPDVISDNKFNSLTGNTRRPKN